MRVAVLGHNSLLPEDASTIKTYLHTFCVQHDLDTIEFVVPVVDGACAIVLNALEEVDALVTAVFPGKRGERPPWSPTEPNPEEAASHAFRTLELGLPMGFHVWEQSLQTCYESVVDYVAQEQGLVLVFWNRTPWTDMSSAVQYIVERRAHLVEVPICGDKLD